jgi:hypothetical protein
MFEDLNAALYTAGEPFVVRQSVYVSHKPSHLDPRGRYHFIAAVAWEYCNVGAIKLTTRIKGFRAVETLLLPHAPHHFE